MPNDLLLYNVFHKKFIQPSVKWVIPVQAGRALATTMLDMEGDNSGENISILNPNFCELTVLYWVWKNEDRERIRWWGLCHYRRHFILPKKRFLWERKKGLYEQACTQDKLDKVVNEKLNSRIQELFKENDIIVQTPIFVSRKKGVILNIEQHYIRDHSEADWNVMIDVIKEKYPSYIKSLDSFTHATHMSFFNMMITSWEIWDIYLEWLFAILFEVKNRITISNDIYEARVFGFMSERLLNLFLLHNKYKIAYLPVGIF